MEIRVGSGYDIHKLARGGKFILGNVEIPFKKGFVAHSDGDVLIHSIIDAMLGALSLGDIGTHFPDNDPAYKNIDSSKLLEKTDELIKKNGYRINNIDSTVICEKPKLKSFILAIKKRLSEILSIDENDISVKAKTKERVDAVGKGKAVEVYTLVLLAKKTKE
jgi:2-C-methyl-D-erythritol 2,4-cyclodiphosphate synthase